MDEGRVLAWASDHAIAPSWLRAALGRSDTCVLLMDPDGIVVQWVGDAPRVLGAARSDVLGKPLRQAVSSVDADRLEWLFRRTELTGEPSRFEGRFRFGTREHHLEVVLADERAAPDVSGFVATVTDVTRPRQAERLLARRATFDPLTGLATRGVLLTTAARTARPDGDVAGLLVVDLARFRLVNEAHGHDVGDQLLVSVGHRLLGALRPDDVVARLGGDELAVLATELGDPASITAVAERLRDALHAGPIEVGGLRLPLRAWIGAQVLCPGDDVDRALQQAVSAAADARSSQRDVVVADDGLRRRAATRATLLQDLDTAIEAGQLQLLFQPIVEPTSGRLVAVEALSRWRHPVHGQVGPDRFVPLAEESGAILRLGRQVLADSLAARARMREVWGVAPEVALNVSPLQLTEGDWMAEVAELLEAAGTDARGLTFELTETVAHEAADVVAELRAIGGRVVVDDFGTGWSSLSLLHRLGVDGLKVDGSFTRRLGTDPEATTLVRAVLALARALDLTATVEGVETTQQRDVLVGLGADRCQGHLWHEPLTLDALLQLTPPRQTVEQDDVAAGDA